MKTKHIRIAERDGFERKAVPCAFTVAFDRGAFRPGDPARLFDPEGQEQAIQVDAVRAWEDGSVRAADVTFSVRLPAKGERVFRFEYGEGATVGAWSDAGAVRYEVGPDGRFRAIFPFERKPCVLYYHYLITPPMDHVHSPAPSMATDPECRVLS